MTTLTIDKQKEIATTVILGNSKLMELFANDLVQYVDNCVDHTTDLQRYVDEDSKGYDLVLELNKRYNSSADIIQGNVLNLTKKLIVSLEDYYDKIIRNQEIENYDAEKILDDIIMHLENLDYLLNREYVSRLYDNLSDDGLSKNIIGILDDLDADSIQIASTLRYFSEFLTITLLIRKGE